MVVRDDEPRRIAIHIDPLALAVEVQAQETVAAVPDEHPIVRPEQLGVNADAVRDERSSRQVKHVQSLDARRKSWLGSYHPLLPRVQRVREAHDLSRSG